MAKKKNKPHHLDDDISPVKRCNKCHQPFSFGKCECKPKKITNKSKFGLTNDEIKVLLKERNINEKDFNKALGTNTCMIINGQTITYHTDIDKALRLLTNKNE